MNEGYNDIKRKKKEKKRKKIHVAQGRGQKQDIRVSLFVLLIYGNLSTFFVPVLFAIKTNYFTDLIYIYAFTEEKFQIHKSSWNGLNEIQNFF